MNNIFCENYKQSRQIKRENDANIKNNIWKYAKRISQLYSISYQNNQLESQFESVRQQQLKSKQESSIKRQFRDISNRRYGKCSDDWRIKKVEVIMDYDFPIQ